MNRVCQTRPDTNLHPFSWAIPKLMLCQGILVKKHTKVTQGMRLCPTDIYVRGCLGRRLFVKHKSSRKMSGMRFTLNLPKTCGIIENIYYINNAAYYNSNLQEIEPRYSYFSFDVTCSNITGLHTGLHSHTRVR